MFKRFLIAFVLLFSIATAGEAKLINIKEVKSRYGLKAWLIEDENSPLVRLTMLFKNSGYVYDPESKQGLANLVSLILQEGMSGKNKIEFLSKLAMLGAEITFAVDEESFYCNLYVLPENLYEAMSLLCQTILSPKLSEEVINYIKEKQNSIRTIVEDDPQYTAKQKFFKVGFADSSYSKSQYGSDKSVSDISLEDIKTFMTNTFNRINLELSIVGNTSVKQIAEIADKYLIDFPLVAINVKRVADGNFILKGGYIVIERNSPQNIIFFGQKSLSIKDRDFYNLLVLNHILGGSGLDSVLMKEIRAKKGYTYGIKTSIYNSASVDLLLGFTTTSAENANEVVLSIKKTISDFQKAGISQEHVELAKQYLIDSFIIDMDKSTNMLTMLTYMQKNNLSIDYPDLYLKGIKNVTSDSVNSLLDNFFAQDSMLFINLGKIKDNS